MGRRLRSSLPELPAHLSPHMVEYASFRQADKSEQGEVGTDVQFETSS